MPDGAAVGHFVFNPDYTLAILLIPQSLQGTQRSISLTQKGRNALSQTQRVHFFLKVSIVLGIESKKSSVNTRFLGQSPQIITTCRQGLG
jgi:hypothetical protein